MNTVIFGVGGFQLATSVAYSVGCSCLGYLGYLNLVILFLV